MLQLKSLQRCCSALVVTILVIATASASAVEVQFRPVAEGVYAHIGDTGARSIAVLFAGDVVYVDRMLGVIPVSNTRRWLETFTVIEQLNPKTIVPGHGSVTNLDTARSDTKAYLDALRAHMKKAVADGIDMSAAVKSFDGRPVMRLLNAAELMPGNASRTYLEMERE